MYKTVVLSFSLFSFYVTLFPNSIFISFFLFPQFLKKEKFEARVFFFSIRSRLFCRASLFIRNWSHSTLFLMAHCISFSCSSNQYLLRRKVICRQKSKLVSASSLTLKRSRPSEFFHSSRVCLSNSSVSSYSKWSQI